MAAAFRDPLALLDYLEIRQEDTRRLIESRPDFRLLVPRPFADKMRKGDINDPLLRQVLPLTEEGQLVSGFQQDPTGDLNALTGQGVMQKYRGRALLVTTAACAVHCRYCFRRHFPYSDTSLDKSAWQTVLDQLSIADDIHEVILSGGDPFMLGDTRLVSLCQDLAAIPAISTIRFHTRVPLILPHRFEHSLIARLGEIATNRLIVIHANHANEIDHLTRQKLILLADSGFTLLNQSVLLKGVNDNPESLADLSHRLFDARVLPYYLHQLDRVQGAAHFEVNDQQALQLMDALRERLPGYLVPRLVREVSGKRSKQPIV